MDKPKYEYYLYLWGGVFNKDDHDIKEGHHWFDTKEERDNYLKYTSSVADSLNRFDAILAHHTAEGFTTRTFPTLNRIVEYKDKQYYSKETWSFPEEDLTVLEYHIEYKWYPGFNDYAVEEELKEEVDYSKVTIISEWIEGIKLIK